MSIEAAKITTVIVGDHDPSRGLNFRELWRHRDLLYFLARRDISVRYKQTVLGPLWAIIHPIISVGVFSIFFGNIAKMPSDGVPYPIFSFSGILLWTYFANTLGRCSACLVGNGHLIRKVYFPRLLLPVTSLVPGFVDFGISFVVLLLGFFAHGMVPAWQALFWVPFFLGLTALLSLGTGMFLGALNVQYRDVNNGISFLLQMLMFSTPVVYPLSLVSDNYRWLMGLNPMVGLIEGFRCSLLGRPIDLDLVGLAAVGIVISLAIGLPYFMKVEKNFADVI